MVLRILTLLFLSVFVNSFSSIAQECRISNGSFESWVDLSEQLSEVAELPEGLAYVPESYVSVTRLLYAFINNFQDSLSIIDLIEFLPNITGVRESEDSSDGLSSVRIGGDRFIPFSDLIGAMPCEGQVADEFKIDIKHIGESTDTITILGVYARGELLTEIPEEFDDLRAYFREEVILDTITDYHTVSIPIIHNDSEIEFDSIALFYLVNNEVVEGDYGYFLIDNARFEIMVGTEDLGLKQNISVYPVPFNDQLTISNENNILDAQLMDLNGRVVKHFTVERGLNSYDMHSIISSGTYFLKLSDKKTHKYTNIPIVKLE